MILSPVTPIQPCVVGSVFQDAQTLAGENLAVVAENCCVKCRLWAPRAEPRGGHGTNWGHLEARPLKHQPNSLPCLGTYRGVQKGSPTHPATPGCHWAFPPPPPPALHLYGGCAALPRDRKWFVCPWWLVWLISFLSGAQRCRIIHLTQSRQSLLSGCLCPFSWNSQKIILLQLLHDQNTVLIGLFKCKCHDIFISRPMHS